MIRNLKVLMLAALALAAFGAFNAVSAHAADEKFHCDVASCRYTIQKDGTGTTAHHVVIVKNTIGESISVTCEQLTGEAVTTTQTTENLTFTGLIYHACKSVLGEATVDFNTCDYKFNSKGGGTDNATVFVECTKAGDAITITNQGCNISISARGPLKGIGYHTIQPVTTEEITATSKVAFGVVPVVASPAGSCGTFDLTKTPITAEYTTGNFIMTAQTGAGTMVNGWWI